MSTQVDQIKASLRAQIRALEQDVRLAIEKVEPSFVMPSFERKVESWSTGGHDKTLFTDARFFDEMTIQVGEKLPDEGDSIGMSEDSTRVGKFRGDELRKLMPPSLRRFADKRRIETATAARLLSTSNLTKFLLIIAEVALELPPTSQPTLTYNDTRVFLAGPPPPSPMDTEPEDRKLRRTIREGQSLLNELEETREALRASAL